MNIGFDLDNIFISTPPLVPHAIIERLYKGRDKPDGELSYRIPSKKEQFLRSLTHHPLLRPALKNNLKIISIYHCDIDLGNGLAAWFIHKVLNLAISIQLMFSDRIIMHLDYSGSIKKTGNMAKKIIRLKPPVNELPAKPLLVRKYLHDKQSDVWIGFVGRIAREKGLEFLISAIEVLKARKLNVTLCIAGPQAVVGEEDYNSYIRSLMDSRGIKYKLFGYLSDEELGSLYKVLDLLVLPSINKTEAFGMVQIEAMLAGTPVIASDMPGVRIPISFTGMGKLVKPKDSNDLAEKITMVLSQKELYAKKVVAAKREFNFHKIIEEYNNVILN